VNDHWSTVSYAHLDNQPLIKDSEGWVSQFHRAVEVRVDQLIGKKMSVWRDPKLQGNDYFDDTILDTLPSAAVLVSIFTPRYVRSESCTKELTRFCEASEKSGGLRILDKTRLFKVLKTPVPVGEHPVEVRDCLGYEFFKTDPVSGRVRELNQVFGGDAERDFWIKLDDLAQDLCQLLNWLDEGQLAESTSDLFEKETTVFLAGCGTDVREQYDIVKRDLLGHKYRVIPCGPLPNDVNELVALLKEALDQSHLSVHLIGNSYGAVPEGTDRSLVELQNDLAIERQVEGDFSRLVWIPPGLEIEDDRQRRFVETLRSDPRAQEGADLLETPLEDLNTQIHHIMAAASDDEVEVEVQERHVPVEIQKRHDPVELQERHDPVELERIYLICDARDAKNVIPVADYLFEQGCEVILSAFHGDEAEVRADHEENLRSADAVLIYYGAPNELWLRGKLRERQKIAGLGRTKPFKATAILIAPPNSQQDNWLRTHEARVIRQPDDFSTSLLDPFLADLRT